MNDNPTQAPAQLNQIKLPESEPISQNPQEAGVKLPKIPSKRSQRVKYALITLLGIFIILSLLIGIPGAIVYGKAKAAKASVDKLQDALKAQDINLVKKEIANTKTSLVSLQGSYKLLLWMKFVPFAGAYVQDGQAAINGGVYGLDAASVIVDTIEPYADIIGFTGDPAKQATSGEENANDRIEFIVQTINDIVPKMSEISEKMNLVKREIDKIDPNRYPESFRGTKVREKVREGVKLVDEASEAISQSKPLLEKATYFLGVEEPRTYLLLFQNDKELRPTGGFLTAYAIMKVEKGKFQQVSSNDIYNLDSRYRPSIPAPEPIIKYLKGPYTVSKNLRLRDMNFDPDFKESMDLFAKESEKAGIKGIDGIIGVDTHVVVKILDVIGQIGVPGFGNFSTKVEPKCDCPQVIYELESYADIEGPVVWDPLDPTRIIFAPANYDNRKKIVGPLMNSILSNALGQPMEKMPKLFQAGWESLTEKHILFYMFDDEAQSAVEAFNIAGRLKVPEGDYLHINDANLGGRKSNLYVTQEVSQEVKVARDGSVEKTLTITYKNPKDYDGWLNSVLPNWTRIYVPKGSQLISADGFEDNTNPYEEGNHTVFAGGFQLRPQGVVKLTVKYKLPTKFKKEYKLLVQKQPGTDSPLYTIKVGRAEEELFLKTDKEFRFGI